MTLSSITEFFYQIIITLVLVLTKNILIKEIQELEIPVCPLGNFERALLIIEIAW